MSVSGRHVVAALVLLAAIPAAVAVAQEATGVPSVTDAPAADGTAAAQAAPAQAQSGALPDVGDLLTLADKATAPADGSNRQADWSAPVKLAIVFAVLAILPSLLVMMTSFTRIVIVLSFVRRALSTQSIPPTIALVGLALFLTIFTMAPTLADMNARAIKPYLDDAITFGDAVKRSNDILKGFMLRQTRVQDLELFANLSHMPPAASAEQVPLHVAIPSFAISEFRTAFEMGFLLFVPFLLIDLVIAGVLLSAGMMMLPPVIISLPFKIVLFILVDGWRLLAESLVSSFSGG
jgi:flagellar biosynthetic protein FliP